MVPLEVTEQGVARAPVVRSIVSGTHAGETPVPCRYRELAADSTTGTPADRHSERAKRERDRPHHHPPDRGDWRELREQVSRSSGWLMGRRVIGRAPSPTAARWPSSHRRRRLSRRRWWTSSVMRPVFGVRNHGPLLLADQAFERGPALERDQRERQDDRAQHPLQVARRRLLQEQPAKVHQRQRQDVGEQQAPSRGSPSSPARECGRTPLTTATPGCRPRTGAACR